MQYIVICLLIPFSDGLGYVVVEFIDEKCVSVVPKKWVNKGDKVICIY